MILSRIKRIEAEFTLLHEGRIENKNAFPINGKAI
jgi:hypothetical protein